MSLVKISQLPAAATILPTIEIPTNNAGINEKITISDIEYARVKSTAADYVGTLIDAYTQIHFNHSASTGLIEFTLPNCAASAGRAYFCQNLALGLSYINGDAANILFKGQALSKLLLVKGGDKCWIRSNGSYWIVESYHMCIESGGINTNDWTARTGLGFANFDYDTKSGGTGDMTGEKYTLASGVTGLILYDSTPAGAAGTLYVCFVTGTGLALNNEVGTCGSGQTFAVDEGSGDNKNQEWNVTHNIGIAARDINSIRFDFGATIATAYYNYGGLIDNTLGRGALITAIDENNLKITTATNGLSDIATGQIDNEDWYYNIILQIIM
jgi:hypothetical protein